MTTPSGPLAHRTMGHVPALDGLRGIAIALVFLVHLDARAFSGGSSGVDLFFVLSGFLITKLALEERDRSGSLSRPDFYLRRAFRILPALFVLLAACLVVSFTLLADAGDVLRREIALSGLSMGNLWPVFYGFEPRTALGHTWSLGLEEQFYLVWPLVLVYVMRARIRPGRLAGGVIAATIASVVIGRVVVLGVLGYPHWQAIPFFNFDGLAIGCLIGIFTHHDTSGRSLRLPRWPAVLAAAVVAFDFFFAPVHRSRHLCDSTARPESRLRLHRAHRRHGVGRRGGAPPHPSESHAGRAILVLAVPLACARVLRAGDGALSVRTAPGSGRRPGRRRDSPGRSLLRVRGAPGTRDGPSDTRGTVVEFRPLRSRPRRERLKL